MSEAKRAFHSRQALVVLRVGAQLIGCGRDRLCERRPGNQAGAPTVPGHILTQTVQAELHLQACRVTRLGGSTEGIPDRAPYKTAAKEITQPLPIG